MKFEKDIKISIVVGIVVFLCLVFCKGGVVASEIKSLISLAVTITVTARFIFLKWIWKLKWFRFLERFHQVPYLEGKWQGEFVSTGNQSAPSDRLTGEVEVQIIQPSLYSIKVKPTSQEAKSSSFAESIDREEDGRQFLTYCYVSEPKASVRDRSPISYGTARLEILEKTLEGRYWTDVKTTGDYSLKRSRS